MALLRVLKHILVVITGSTTVDKHKAGQKSGRVLSDRFSHFLPVFHALLPVTFCLLFLLIHAKPVATAKQTTVFGVKSEA